MTLHMELDEGIFLVTKLGYILSSIFPLFIAFAPFLSKTCT